MYYHYHKENPKCEEFVHLEGLFDNIFLQIEILLNIFLLNEE